MWACILPSEANGTMGVSAGSEETLVSSALMHKGNWEEVCGWWNSPMNFRLSLFVPS